MAQINLTGSIGVPGNVPVLGSANVVFTSNSHTLTAAEYSNKFLYLTSSTPLTALGRLIAPSVQGQEFVIFNNTSGGQAVQVVGASGSLVVIPNSQTVSVVHDGYGYSAAIHTGGSINISSSKAGSTGMALQSGNITASSNILTLTSGTFGISLFQSSDVGKSIQITGVGSGRSDLYSTITDYTSPTRITIADIATFSTPDHAPATVIWYPVDQDDTIAIQTAIDATNNNANTVHLQAGVYVISSPLVSSQFLQVLQGDGLNQTYVVVDGYGFTGDMLDFSSTARGLTISGLSLKHAGLSTAASSALITAWSIFSNVITFTASNEYTTGQEIAISGFQNTGSPFNDVFTAVLSSGLSSSQFECLLTPTALTGTTASITASGTSVVLTGGIGFIPNVAFLSVTISGAANSANNGNFVVSAFNTATSLTFTNPSAAAGDDANNGAIYWIIDGYGTDIGVAHLDYNCIDFSLGNNTLVYANLTGVQMISAPGNGLKCASAIVSQVSGCVALRNNSHGFAVYNFQNVGSTSVVFNNCYSNANYEAGYYAHTINYSSFNGCAADSNGISYYLFNGKNISMTGCGSEASVFNNAAYPGWHFYIHGGQGNVLSGCYTDADSGSANLNGVYLVLDNQASQNTITNMIFTGFSNQPANAFYIHFSCFDNTIWEPYFASQNKVTAWSVTSDVATFTAANSYQANQNIMLSGFISNGVQFNNVIGTVQSSGLSFTRFELTGFTLNGSSVSFPDGSGTDTGNARIGWVDIGVNDTIYYGGTYHTPVGFLQPLNLGIGPNYAQSGSIRGVTGSRTLIAIRDAAGTGDIGVLKVSSAGSVILGDGVNVNNANLNVPSGNLVQLQGTGSNALSFTINPTGTTTEQFAATVTSAVINQAATSVASAVGATLTIQAQNATGTTATGGETIITSGTGTTAAGSTVLRTGGTTRLTANPTGVITIANLGTGVVHADSSGNLTSSLIVNADVAAAGTANIAVNKLAAGTSAQILLNSSVPTPTWTTITGDVSLTNAGVISVVSLTGAAGVINAGTSGNVITWAAGTTLPGLGQTIRASDIATNNLVITSQAPFASASTHQVAGNIILNCPQSVGATSTRPYVNVQYDGYSEWNFGPLNGSGGNTAAIYFGGGSSSTITPSTTNYVLNATASATVVQSAGSTGTITLSQNNAALLTLGAGGLQLVSVTVPITTTPQVLTTAQAASPFIKLTSASLAGNTVITFPATNGGMWIIDATGVTLNGHTLSVQVGSTVWGTTIGTTNLYQIIYSSAQTKLYGQTLTP